MKLNQSKNSEVKKLLDRLFSQWVRRKAADYNGNAACFTCGTVKKWYHLENGHFIDRAHMCTRYHEQNNHPQCVNCNRFLKGNLEVYARNLDLKYGTGTAEKLEALGRRTCKVNRAEMVEMINKLDREIGEMIDGKR